MKIFIVLLAVCLSSFSAKGQKLFDLIEKKDASKLKAYFKGEVNPDDLFCSKTTKDGDSTISYTFSIIEWAAVKDCQECLEIIVKNEKKVKKDLYLGQELNKCLSHAVSRNNKNMFDYLIKKGADVNTSCVVCHGQSPIQIALTYGNYEMFYSLLRLGAKTDGLNIRNQNLIHILLINYEDTRMYPDAQGKLTIPAVTTAKNVLDTLIERKVSVNDKTVDGFYAWMYAALTNQPILYDAVQNHKAPYDKSDFKIIYKLLEFSVYYPSSEKAVYNNMFDKVIAAEGIELTADLIDRSDLYGGELLITYAAEMNNEVVFEKLMKYNPGFDAVDPKGNSVMYYALENGNAKICNILLDIGIVVSEKEYNQATKVFKTDKVLVEKFKKAVEK